MRRLTRLVPLLDILRYQWRQSRCTHDNVSAFSSPPCCLWCGLTLNDEADCE